jgi:hypothetical protein
MTIDEELPQRVRQAIRATMPMRTLFFNPSEFALVNLLPQNKSVTAAYLVDGAIISFAGRHAQQRVTLPVANCICISTIPSTTLPGMSKKIWPTMGASMFPTPRIHPIWPSWPSTHSNG